MSKEYYLKNIEKFQSYRKKEWEKIKNDEELHKKNKEYHREYYQQHKNDAKYIEYKKNKWKKTKNDPKLFEINKRRINKWRSTASGIYTSLKNRNRKDFCLDKDDFISWYEKQVQKCSYCGLTLKQIRELPYPYNRKNGLIKFSIDRKDNSIGYRINNICLSCFTCNTIKNNFLTHNEMKKIGEIILKPKFKKILKEI